MFSRRAVIHLWRPLHVDTISLINSSITPAFSRSLYPSIHPPFELKTRSFKISRPIHGLEEFFTGYNPKEPVGRHWRVNELRLKSYEDLRKLWFVLLKERNMLYTYKKWCAKTRTEMIQPMRLKKVKDSMRGIRIVLGERSLAYKYATNPRFASNQDIKRLKKQRKRKLISDSKKYRAPPTQHIKGVQGLRVKQYKFRFLKPREEDPEEDEDEYYYEEEEEEEGEQQQQQMQN